MGTRVRVCMVCRRPELSTARAAWLTPLPSLGGAPAESQHRCGRALQAQWGVENNRALPEWGRAVLSDLCIMMTPAGEAELTAFVKYCIALAHAYLEVARHVQAPTSNLCAPSHPPAASMQLRPVARWTASRCPDLHGR